MSKKIVFSPTSTCDRATCTKCGKNFYYVRPYYYHYKGQKGSVVCYECADDVWWRVR